MLPVNALPQPAPGVARALAVADSDHRPAADPPSPQHGPGTTLGRALRPLVDPLRAALLAHTAPGTPAHGHALSSWAHAVADQLTDELADLAAPVLLASLHDAREQGRLRGASSAERFCDHVEWLASGGVHGLLADHPGLSELLEARAAGVLRWATEVVDHLVADAGSLGPLRTASGAGADGDDLPPSPLVSLRALGDRHDGGRAVSLLTFADGTRVVHRPRPVTAHHAFAELLAWLDERAGITLTVPRVLAVADHGWVEVVATAPCADRDAARRFHRRQGALLAVLHALGATDVHGENLLAVGEHPVLVDIETLFHPVLPVPAPLDRDPASTVLRTSVQRTSLLPTLLLDEDGERVETSGLAGGSTTGATSAGWVDTGLDTMRRGRVPAVSGLPANRPVLDGEPLDPRHHRADLVAGFTGAYDTLTARRDELAAPGGPLEAFAAAWTRVVVRPTSLYTALLAATTQPEVAREPGGRESVLRRLAHEPADGVRPLLVEAEVAALLAGDIPVFATSPDSHDLRTAEGLAWSGALPTTGLDAALAALASAGEVERHRQEWILRAALATTAPPEAAPPCAGGPARRSGSVDPGELLRAATGIADDLLATSVSHDGRTNWLGLELVDDRDWALLPMGAGLGQGYTGVALFLAEIGSLTGSSRFLHLAADAVAPLPELVRTFEGHPWLAGDAGPGMEGLGGIAHALARIDRLVPGRGADGTLATLLEVLTRVVEGTDPDQAPDLTWDHGLAGAVAAGTAVLRSTRASTPERARAHALSVRLTRAAASRLLEGVLDGTAAGLPAGFAKGRAGIATALARYADDAGPAVALAAQRAATGLLTPTRTGDGVGWCTGSAGLLAASSEVGRRASGTWAATPDPSLVVEHLVAVGRAGTPEDLSACHGWSGSLDPVVDLAARGHETARAVLRSATPAVLDAVRSGGPLCATPDGVPTPGLRTGLAGVGLGLLRLASGSVPSALTLTTVPPTTSLTRERP